MDGIIKLWILLFGMNNFFLRDIQNGCLGSKDHSNFETTLYLFFLIQMIREDEIITLWILIIGKKHFF